MNDFTATADRRCDPLGREIRAAKRAGSPFVTSTYCLKYASAPSGLRVPVLLDVRAGFVTNRHE